MALFRKIFSKIKPNFTKLNSIILKYPILSILAFPLYIIITFIILALLLVIIFSISFALKADSRAPEVCFSLIGTLVFIFIWVHYFYLIFSALFAGIHLGKSNKIITLLQSAFSTIFFFSILYYYIQLFSKNKAFVGMTEIKDDPYRNFIGLDIPDIDHLINLLVIIPKIDTIVDCFYFSVVTIATVGFGDIHPSSSIAKIATSLEVIFGFLLLVVSIGTIFGESQNEQS